MRTAEILLYDVIGSGMFFDDGISSASFVEALATLDLRAEDTLVIRVDSPGGMAGDGLAIYNSLLSYPARKIARVEGYALSAASFVIQACDEIECAAASFMMVHRAQGGGLGDCDLMLAEAEILEKHDIVLAEIYAARSKRPAEEWLAEMAAETWYTGQEAVAAGLADRLIETPALKAEALASGRAARWPAERSESMIAAYRRIPVAAMLPRAEGKVLSAVNKSRLNQIRGLAQEVLDTADPPEASASNAPTNNNAWLRRAELTIMEADLAQALAAEG